MLKRAQAILGSLLFLVIAPGTVAGLIPWWICRWRFHTPFAGYSSIRMIGAILIVAGLPVLLDSFARFAFQGLGTPAPLLPTKHLVVTGMYRHVRNPMYVAVSSLIFGQVLLFGSISVFAYGAIVWLAFQLFVALYEEPTLRKTYGAEYEEFCRNVPRWIPRLRPWRGLE
jgi:protein-S-isoprenylcysteine O-methyltransferase Ste14